MSDAGSATSSPLAKRPSIAKSLAWKDAKIIFTFTIAIAIAMVVFNVLGLSATLLADYSTQDQLGVSVAICCGLSYLFALGVAPTLVGNEEEAGTLGWLRTLPVGWARVTSSKLCVSLAAMLLVWTVGGVLLVSQFLVIAAGSNEAWIDDVWSPKSADILGVFVIIGVSFLIWACSFACSFLLRSPMAAVVAFFPVFFAAMLGIAFTNDQVIRVGFGISFGKFDSFPLAAQVAFISVPVVIFIGFVGLIYLLAWQRLRGQGRYEHWTARSQAAFALHEAPISIRLQRPSINRALVWQQLRHISPFAIPILLISFVCCLSSGSFSFDRLNEKGIFGVVLAANVVVLSATWIGGVTFFSDNVRRRVGFFADRGVSVHRFWWTRVLVSAWFLFALIACVAMSFWVNENRPPELSWSVIIIGLSLAWSQSVLISMVAGRPILGLFGSVILWAIWPLFVGWFYVIYVDYLWTLGFAVPILLFASWRLCRFWMNGEMGKGFQARRIGYLALAIGLPMLVTMIHRYATLPKIDLAWRNQMMQMDLPGPDQLLAKGRQTPWSNSISIDALAPVMQSNRRFTPASYVGRLPEEAQEVEWLKRMGKEIVEDESIGKYVSWAELNEVLVGSKQPTPWPSQWGMPKYVRLKLEAQDFLSYDPMEFHIKSVEVLLAWSNRARKMIVQGDEGIATLLRVAEPAEHLAVISMLWWNQYPESVAEIKRLRDLLPSDELRRESRRIAIVDHWRWFHRQHWKKNSDLGKAFAGDPMLSGQVNWLSVEQERSERMVDQAIRQLLFQVQSPINLSSDPTGVLFTHDWIHAMHGPWASMNRSSSTLSPRGHLSVMISWVQGLSDHEQRINRLYRR